MVKNLPVGAEDVSLILGLGKSLEEEMATHSSILAWEIPRTEEPGGSQSLGVTESQARLTTACAWLLSCVSLFCDPMDYSPPGSSVHGIPQARILEWVAISFSRGSS